MVAAVVVGVVGVADEVVVVGAGGDDGGDGGGGGGSADDFVAFYSKIGPSNQQKIKLQKLRKKNKRGFGLLKEIGRRKL